MKIEVNCFVCNKKYELFKSLVKKENICSRKSDCWTKYCSIRASRKKYEKVAVKCLECGSEFNKTPYRSKITNKHYCSMKCYHSFRTKNDSWKNKISQTRINKGLSKGKNNCNYNNKNNFYGENHPNYKDGRSFRVRQYREIYTKFYNDELVDSNVIHHIDCDHYNNDPKNLFKCEGPCEHLKLHRSLEKVASLLIKNGLIKFDREKRKYYIDEGDTK